MPKARGVIHTARNGAKYILDKKTGRAKFVSGPKKKKKGGSVRVGGATAVGGSAKKRKGGSVRTMG